jgi:hypothetical protein
MDNLTIAVLAGGGIVTLVFVLMFDFDREPAPQENAPPPAKPGKR